MAMALIAIIALPGELTAQSERNTNRPSSTAAPDAEKGDGDMQRVVSTPENGTSATVGLDTAETRERPSRQIWDLVKASGGIGVLIFLLSIALVALIIENLFRLRRGLLVPLDLVEELESCVERNHFDKAEERCRSRRCLLSSVVLTGLREIPFGYPAVEKSLEDAASEQSASLMRKVEYFSLIGNVAPMLGLLGTVYGLVLAFRRVAESQGSAVAADLADGIYLALMTTVMGLIVSIPALSAYAIFRGRIEKLSAEAALAAERVFLPYKRAWMPRVMEETVRSHDS
ncbi:Biopolymer transport protein ExbB [Planctomycetes bacterium Pan216]|uniref:Biopolymer transport protein ExbB n=1 Tax=Kolteria novifilia TaxID=2527975 RepID=A0A518B7Q3_9BACT|nr:Biopolymer transport protein ExbB [Planctomycetes bacterium Pan216]